MNNYNSNFLFQFFLIARKFNLPSDLQFYLFNHFINASAQLIIHNWYNFISIHNTNLCYLVNKLNIIQGHDFTGSTLHYYDINDKTVQTTFKICFYYIKPKISSKSWWIQIIEYANNGFYFIDNHNDLNIKNTFFYISNIHYLFKTKRII